MKSIKKIAYEKYQKDWLLNHGYSSQDLKENSEIGIPSLFAKCDEQGQDYDSFLEKEYMNPDYIEPILSETEYLRYYEDYLKTYKKKNHKSQITTKIDKNVIAISFYLDIKLINDKNKLWPAVKSLYEQEHYGKKKENKNVKRHTHSKSEQSSYNFW